MSFDILIVDDEEDIRNLVGGILLDEGYSTRKAACSSEAFELVLDKIPDLVILDIWLRDSEYDGLEILEKLHNDYPSLPIIMISGHGNIETAVFAIKIGAYDFIEKPFKSDRLLLMIRRGLEHFQLKKENIELKSELCSGESHDIIGNSNKITQLRNNLQKVAPTNSRVLIMGDAGTGKNVVARRIHNLSENKDMPFVVLSCACIDPLRLEAEIFGNEDNGNVYQGVFERADGGTLLLDEVSDLPLSIQGRLVRIIQDQNFNRINGGELVRTNVRVIASTTKILSKMMEEGEFRQDLYFRLNVVPIMLPALSDHLEDIENISKFFINQYAVKHGVKELELDNGAIAMLQTYSWPGNIRQLRNVIDWLMIMNSHGKDVALISSDDLPPEIKGTINDCEISSMNEFIGQSLRDARESFEKYYIEMQLNKFSGNVSRTAQFIGMERSALHRKIKSLNISDKDSKLEIKISA